MTKIGCDHLSKEERGWLEEIASRLAALNRDSQLDLLAYSQPLSKLPLLISALTCPWLNSQNKARIALLAARRISKRQAAWIWLHLQFFPDNEYLMDLSADLLAAWQGKDYSSLQAATLGAAGKEREEEISLALLGDQIGKQIEREEPQLKAPAEPNIRRDRERQQDLVVKWLDNLAAASEPSQIPAWVKWLSQLAPPKGLAKSQRSTESLDPIDDAQIPDRTSLPKDTNLPEATKQPYGALGQGRADLLADAELQGRYLVEQLYAEFLRSLGDSVDFESFCRAFQLSPQTTLLYQLLYYALGEKEDYKLALSSAQLLLAQLVPLDEAALKLLQIYFKLMQPLDLADEICKFLLVEEEQGLDLGELLAPALLAKLYYWQSIRGLEHYIAANEHMLKILKPYFYLIERVEFVDGQEGSALPLAALVYLPRQVLYLAADKETELLIYARSLFAQDEQVRAVYEKIEARQAVLAALSLQPASHGVSYENDYKDYAGSKGANDQLANKGANGDNGYNDANDAMGDNSKQVGSGDFNSYNNKVNQEGIGSYLEGLKTGRGTRALKLHFTAGAPLLYAAEVLRMILAED